MRCYLCGKAHWRIFKRKGRQVRFCRKCASWLMCEFQAYKVNPQEWLKGL